MWVLTELEDFIFVNLNQVQYLQVKESGKGTDRHRIKLMAFLPGAKGRTKGITLKTVYSPSEWERLRASLFKRIEEQGDKILDFSKLQYWLRRQRQL